MYKPPYPQISSDNLRIQLIGIQTLMRKEMTRVLRIWPQSLLPSAVTSTLYFMIFGTIVGNSIDTGNAYSFMEFIAPGLIIMAIINNAYANTSSMVFGLKFARAIEEELVAPLSPVSILIGHVMGGLLRGLLVGAIVITISLFFTPLNIHSPFILFSTAALSSWVFSTAGFFNALFAKKFDDVALIPNFVLTPLTYLGGIFYSVQELASPWRELAHFNPILYIVNTFRYCMLGVTDVNPFITLFLLIILAITLSIICIRMIRDGRWLKL